jgi:hypothetical protein
VKRWVKKGVIWTALIGVAVIVLLIASQSYFVSLDRAANYAFGEKAQQNKIEGMSEDAVRKLFGTPDYIHRDKDYSTGAPYHVLVYTPGPRLALWNSECKINIDDQTGKVQGWMMNSD